MKSWSPCDNFSCSEMKKELDSQKILCSELASRVSHLDSLKTEVEEEAKAVRENLEMKNTGLQNSVQRTKDENKLLEEKVGSLEAKLKEQETKNMSLDHQVSRKTKENESLRKSLKAEERRWREKVEEVEGLNQRLLVESKTSDGLRSDLAEAKGRAADGQDAKLLERELVTVTKSLNDKVG